MFGIGSTELLVIFILALLILGPKKIPELARSIGRTLGELRRTADELRETIEEEVEPLKDEIPTEQFRKMIEEGMEEGKEEEKGKKEESGGEKADLH
ncbi:MAG: twin-arginine translocase subunit TatB [Deltaproteobacteria bacterium]|nr:MAG: twin-arginine translocase subunit TatB [Deltaproteobacteria bacterium]